MSNLAQQAFERGEGILRMALTWVPRTFYVPGKRLKLHPSDLHALGSNRGGIDERWFASTTHADNGPLTLPNEGLSYVPSELQGALIGQRIWNDYQDWPAYAKFFDNKGARPHHLHHRQEHAELVGLRAKPEA